MKKLIFTIAILATLSMSSMVVAQGPGGGQRGGQRGGGGQGGQRGGGPRPVSPMMTALDVDKDGTLSAEEIANATKMLQTLDANGDGVLEASELAPPRGQGQGGSRGGGQGGGGRGGDPSERVDRMMEMDADGDGKISAEEGGEKMARFFGHLDADSDGFVTRQEIEQMMSRRGGGGGAGRGGRGGGRPGGGGQQKTERPEFE